MKKVLALAAAAWLLGQGVWAQSPIPTFDKEAVTVHPYNRTGDQDVVAGEDTWNGESYRPGNTGTEEAPAFYVKKIHLTGFALPDKKGQLEQLIHRYEGRSLAVSELGELTAKITAYAKRVGYPVAQAVVPPQEINDGTLEIRLYVARYDKVALTKNTTAIGDGELEKYLRGLKPGEVITDKTLESIMNRVNDLPGVVARAVLKPGGEMGTTSVDVEATRRPIWNNYVFVDNGGGYYSGRYRYGFNTEINNPGKMGDKLILNGMLSSHDVKNYGIRYELPVGTSGTRVGVAWSRVNYEMHTNRFFDTLGKSEGISIYGMTPLYRDRANRLTAIYGYDHRDLQDELRFNIAGLGRLRTDKDADVWHAGLSGSRYAPNEFTQYSLIYWYGEIDTDGGAYYDGSYHKLTGDFFHVWYDGPWNFRLKASGQIANRPLDGSEQFYLGGINGVRAYGASDGYGDTGYVATAEVRRATGIPGLEVAAFVDMGAVKNKFDGTMDHLAGWGVGLRYGKQGDWYAQLDYARKIDARPDRIEPDDHSGRLWFQLYKMF